MKHWLNELLDRIFVVAGAFLFSQAPVYFQQYTQRLGGHVGELQRQISVLQSNAVLSGKTLDQYVSKFLGSPDPDFSLQGKAMQLMLDRYVNLTQAYQSLLQATPIHKPVVFVQHFQPDIAKLALSDFSFGLQFTTEALAYALLGIVCGYLIFRVVEGIVILTGRALAKSSI